MRALLRLAARDARRDRWRTVLVVLMVTLPVAGLVGLVAFIDTTAPTAAERATAEVGGADAFARPVAVFTSDQAVADLHGRLPTGSRVEVVVVGNDVALGEGRRRPVNVTDERLDPGALSAGRVELVGGTAPTGVGEVVVSSRLADDLGLAVGGSVELETLGPREVVGIARRLERLSAVEVFVGAGQVPDGWVDRVLFDVPDPQVQPLVRGTDVVVDGVGDWDEPVSWEVTTREAAGLVRFSSGSRFALVVIGGVAAVEVALVAGAAFAVSVRRRQRELGLLAAVGGSQRHVRRVVLLTGAVAGAVGAVIGTALAVLALVAARPWLDDIAGRVTGGPSFDPAWIALCMALGIVAVVVGAWLPARTVARLPVTVALSGRRPTPVPSRRGLAWGLGLLAVGVAVLVAATTARHAYVFVGGCVLVVLGAGWTSPWLIERLASFAPRLPVGLRLALRDAARYRTRNGPIVTAAMAALAAGVTGAAVLGSLHTEMVENQRAVLAPEHLIVSGEPTAAGIAATSIGGALDTEPLRMENVAADVTDAATDWWLHATWGTPQLAAILGGPAAVSALEAGQAVVLAGDSQDGGSVMVRFHLGIDRNGETVLSDAVEVPATVVPGKGPEGEPWMSLPAVLLPAELRELAFSAEASTGQVVVQTQEELASRQWHNYLMVLDGPVTGRDLQVVDAEVGRIGRDVVFVQSPYQDTGDRLMRIAVVSVGVVAGLAVVAVAIALAAAEGRADLRTLAAVGAGRRSRRSLAVGRALLLSGLGGVLAVPVGLIPAFVVLTNAGRDMPLHVPWLTIAIVVVLVPLVSAVGAAIAARREPAHLARAA